MDNKEFIELCFNELQKYYNNEKKMIITKDDMYVVWSCKILQNNKTLLSTNMYDGMYYEITYNGDKNEMYFDAYKKSLNYKIEGVN